MPFPHLLLTIDVEEDMPGWKITNPITTHNARALPAIQAMCEQIGVRPTYLCTYPMITQPEPAAILKQLSASGNCEISTHLHPWNTPPFGDAPGRNDDERKYAYYMNSLGPDRFRAKLHELTRAITALTGNVPRTFRAGRFGIDGTTMSVLADEGYAVDSSVTPLSEHTQDGGPDFRRAPQLPYFPSARNVCTPGDLSIVEIPVSVTLTKNMPTRLQSAFVRIPQRTRIRGLLSHDYLNVIDFAWLYPVRFDLEIMKKAADALQRHGSPVFNVFLHSSELVPGQSAGITTADDAKRCIARLRGILEYCISRHGAVGRTLDESGREIREWIAGRLTGC